MKNQKVYLVYHGYDGDSGFLTHLFQSKTIAKRFIKNYWAYLSKEHPYSDSKRDLVAGYDPIEKRTKWARIDERTVVCE